MSCCCGVMTSAGDTLSHDGTAPVRVAISSQDKVYTVGSSGLPEWKDIPSQIPFTANGDILTRAASETVVLPIGFAKEVLTVNSQRTEVEWASPLPEIGEHDEMRQVLQLVPDGNPLYGGFAAGWGKHLDSGDGWDPDFVFTTSNVSLNTNNDASGSWTRIGNQITAYYCVSLTIDDLSSFTTGDDVSFTMALPKTKYTNFTHAQEARVIVSSAESNPTAIVSYDQIGGRAIPGTKRIGVSARVRSTGQRNMRFAICANYNIQ